MSPYTLSNDHDAAADHHAALSALLDADSAARVDELTDVTGAHVAELGAGRGAFALWLARRVGPAGSVVAADLDPGRLPDHPRLRPVAQDLTAQRWAPDLAGPFGLVHARLTLQHIPARRDVLQRMVGRVAVGGWVLVEDWAVRRSARVIDAPDDQSAQLFARYQRAAADLFVAGGVDPEWAASIHTAMRDDPRLTDVQTRVFGGYWSGGSPGCRLVAAVIPQIADRLRRTAGFTDGELLQLVDLLRDDDRLIIDGHPLYSTAGRRA